MNKLVLLVSIFTASISIVDSTWGVWFFNCINAHILTALSTEIRIFAIQLYSMKWWGKLSWVLVSWLSAYILMKYLKLKLKLNFYFITQGIDSFVLGERKPSFERKYYFQIDVCKDSTSITIATAASICSYGASGNIYWMNISMYTRDWHNKGWKYRHPHILK